MENNKSNISIVDIMLIIGCLGLVEMLLVKVFWEAVIYNEALRVFRSGQLVDKLTQFAIIIGVIALFNYLIGLFTASSRNKTLRNYLAVTFIIGLIVVFNLHHVM